MYFDEFDERYKKIEQMLNEMLREMQQRIYGGIVYKYVPEHEQKSLSWENIFYGNK